MKNIKMWLCVLVIVCLTFSIIQAVQAEQKLKIAFSSNIVTVDPAYYINTTDLFATDLIYDTLLQYDLDRNIAPRLATSWKQIDEVTWEFMLREGVTFHSGNIFNADAVKYSIERFSTSRVGVPYLGMVDHVEVISDYVVRIHLKNEYGPILNNLTCPAGGIMDPMFVEEKGEDISQFASGTGPYKLEEFTPGSILSMVKNEKYWGKTANIEKVDFLFIPEETTRLMALQTGEVDIIESPPTHEIEGLRQSKNLYVYIAPKLRVLFLGFNMKDPNVGGEENQALREAISYAIDREEIANYLLDGLASKSDTMVAEIATGPLRDTSLVRNYNPEKAKQILKDAGIQPGRTVEFLVTTGRYLMDSEIAEVIQQQVAKVGINLKITLMEYAALWSTLKGDEHQMFQIAYGCPAGEPGQPYTTLLSFGGHTNFAKWGNEETDKLLYSALKTVDVENRLAGYEEVYRLVFKDVAYIPLLLYQSIYAANNKVKNLYVKPEEYIDVKNIYIED